jgi:hypothetical protein
MRMSGINIHCDVVPRAGQRKATRGNSGLTVLLGPSNVTILAVVGVRVNGESNLFFFLARWEAAGEDICSKYWPLRGLFRNANARLLALSHSQPWVNDGEIQPWRELSTKTSLERAKGQIKANVSCRRRLVSKFSLFPTFIFEKSSTAHSH